MRLFGRHWLDWAKPFFWLIGLFCVLASEGSHSGRYWKCPRSICLIRASYRMRMTCLHWVSLCRKSFFFSGTAELLYQYLYLVLDCYPYLLTRDGIQHRRFCSVSWGRCWPRKIGSCNYSTSFNPFYHSTYSGKRNCWRAGAAVLPPSGYDCQTINGTWASNFHTISAYVGIDSISMYHLLKCAELSQFSVFIFMVSFT